MFVAVLGFFLYAVRPVMQAWLLETTPRNMGGTSIGVLFGAQALGSSAAPLLAGIIADRFGLGATFYFLAGTIVVANMKKKGRRPVDYFRMFFADTAINGSRSGTRCGIDFFGCEHVLFGTDCPFDPQGGPLFIRDIIKVLDEIDITESERRQIYQLNAERMLKLKPR